MDITAYCHGGIDNLNVGFLNKELSGFVTEFADGGFWDWFAGAEGLNRTGPGAMLVEEGCGRQEREGERGEEKEVLPVKVTHDGAVGGSWGRGGRGEVGGKWGRRWGMVKPTPGLFRDQKVCVEVDVGRIFGCVSVVPFSLFLFFCFFYLLSSFLRFSFSFFLFSSFFSLFFFYSVSLIRPSRVCVVSCQAPVLT